MTFADKSFRVTRRKLLLGAGASTLALSAPVQAAQPQQRVSRLARGFVFEDAHGDGVRRPGSKGIAGVMVSNGCDVVRTADDGSWNLSVSDGDSIFVIKPPHWSTPSGGGIPAFYRHYQPEGTPPGVNLKFATVAPTGRLAGSIDFPLTRQVEAGQFEALLFADMQPGNATELGYVAEDLLAAVQATRSEFAINHGDVMGDDLSLFPRYVEMIAATGMRWHHCPGNHDMNLDSPTARYAFETWKREIGPTHYAFQHSGATFILLNNVDYYGRGRVPRGQRAYRGMIGERQLQFVANVLANVPRQHLVVVSMHIPLLSFEDADSPSDNTADRRHLLELLSRHPNTVSFSGHSHTTEHHYFGREHGFHGAVPHHHHVLTAMCGSWWSGPKDQRGVPVSDSRDGSPRGYHVLSVEGNAYSTRFVATSRQGERQMRIVLGPRGCAEPALGELGFGAAQAGNYVFVDVFDGGPRTNVWFEIEGSGQPPCEMTRVRIADPYIIEQFARHAGLCKPWVEPAVSSHMWVATMPCGLGPGSYRVVARAIDQYGREHVARRPIEVAV